MLILMVKMWGSSFSAVANSTATLQTLRTPCAPLHILCQLLCIVLCAGEVWDWDRRLRHLLPILFMPLPLDGAQGMYLTHNTTLC